MENNKKEIKLNCGYCGGKMTVLEDGKHFVVHCLNKVSKTTECPSNGANSLIVEQIKGLESGKAIAENFLFLQWSEREWLKKDAVAWLNEKWKKYCEWEYNQ